ncbi:MAG: class I SAM-dependent DNA methyltransferase, partial [Dehalococcoidia bacterium]|nr:class I SAM-dependent DNA methyltransferase [Dehalococcoidia bacterium]
LYVALRLLLDLEKEVGAEALALGLPRPAPSVSPAQLHGIEVNAYAFELAQATVQIGYIQWLRENGYGSPGEPILKPLDTFLPMDAILAYDDEGKPVEPEWPEADVIIGNPPFLGGNKIRQGLGDRYVEDLFDLYKDRVPAFADLVCYWHEKARAQIEQGRAKRAGLLATQAIRGGANRKVLERVKASGDIFWAHSDRDWILDGAMVHVSMVGFDQGREIERTLNGRPVTSINADLTATADLTSALRLAENEGIAFVGDTKKGRFDVPKQTAMRMLLAPQNPNGRPNSDVLRPWINGLDITGRPREMWIVDFGVDMSEAEAALYGQPFEYVRKQVKPARDRVRNPRERSHWWLHGRPAPDFRAAVRGLQRYIATPRVSKHRLFVYVDSRTLPDGQVVVFARNNDYFLGVLQSGVHELWARGTGTQLREAESGFRYSQTMTFETFPLPWPPGQEPTDDPRVQAIAEAARELVEKRDAWLNPPGAAEAELKKRTLTNLYNQRPTWLQLAHKKLDEAVLDAYGWPHDLTDEEILERLLELNLERGEGREGGRGARR